MAKGLLLPKMQLPPLLPGATSGSDQLSGSNGADLINGLAGNDLIYGGDGNDLIYGDAGNDSIFGGSGNDVLHGGSGDDTIVTGPGFDEVYDGDGADVVVLSGHGIVHAAVDWGGNTYVASAAGGDGPQTLAYGENAGVDIDLVQGTAERAFIVQGDTPRYVFGTDSISGFNRFVIGEGYLVRFKGSDSAETLISLHTEQHDIHMGGGNDVVKVNGGPNDHGESYVYGGSGDDLIIGGGGMWDRFFGEDGNDRIFGSTRGEELAVGRLGDMLSGGAGDDVITGGNTDSGLMGDAGNDILRGRDAREDLYGGEGRDRMSGGGNSDQFCFGSVADSGPADFDTILDFSASQGDKLNLHVIDAIAATVGDDAFSLIGIADFSGVAGELRLDVRNGYAMLEADVTGDGAADFAVKLVGVSSLSLADFLLPGGYSGL